MCFHGVTYLSLSKIPRKWYYYFPHFTDGGIEAQRDYTTFTGQSVAVKWELSSTPAAEPTHGVTTPAPCAVGVIPKQQEETLCNK